MEKITKTKTKKTKTKEQEFLDQTRRSRMEPNEEMGANKFKSNETVESSSQIRREQDPEGFG